MAAEVMSRCVTAKLGLLAVPSAEWLRTLWLLLPEGIAKHVKEIIRVGSLEALYELITVLDELRLMIMDVSIQRNLVKPEGFQGAVRCNRRHRQP
jgi:hypothetical protein